MRSKGFPRRRKPTCSARLGTKTPRAFQTVVPRHQDIGPHNRINETRADSEAGGEMPQAVLTTLARDRFQTTLSVLLVARGGESCMDPSRVQDCFNVKAGNSGCSHVFGLLVGAKRAPGRDGSAHADLVHLFGLKRPLTLAGLQRAGPTGSPSTRLTSFATSGRSKSRLLLPFPAAALASHFRLEAGAAADGEKLRLTRDRAGGAQRHPFSPVGLRSHGGCRLRGSRGWSDSCRFCSAAPIALGRSCWPPPQCSRHPAGAV